MFLNLVFLSEVFGPVRMFHKLCYDVEELSGDWLD